MQAGRRGLGLVIALAGAIPLFGGCAALAPDRVVQSTMRLAPGQAIAGRFESLDGGHGFVHFQREAPRKGVAPCPGATTYTSDGRVLIAFPGTTVPDEHPLGYAQAGFEAGRGLRVILRNASTEPATFDWVVTGSGDIVADWDVAGSERP